MNIDPITGLPEANLDKTNFVRYMKLTKEEIDELIKFDFTNWREEAKKKDKVVFDDHYKSIFLGVYARTGKRSLATKATGFCPATIHRVIKSDQEFAEMVDYVFKVRSELICQQLEEEFLNGHIEPIVTKDGVIVGEKIKYESNARLKMLQRYDDAYNDKNDFSINNNSGGVLVVPESKSAEDWLKQAQMVKKDMLAEGNIDG